MKYCRAKRSIFEGDLLPLDDHILVGIREAAAISRPNIIDAAKVIASQKGAGALFNHVIPIFIQTQISFNKR